MAEVKFRKEPERYAELIRAKDRTGLNEAITNATVEKKVLERLRLKAKTYGTDPERIGALVKIDINSVVNMYHVRKTTIYAKEIKLLTTLIGLCNTFDKRG